MIFLAVSPLICGMGVFLLPVIFFDGMGSDDGEWYEITETEGEGNVSFLTFDTYNKKGRALYFLEPDYGAKGNYSITMTIYSLKDEDVVDEQTISNSSFGEWTYKLDVKDQSETFVLKIETENVRYHSIVIQEWWVFDW